MTTLAQPNRVDPYVPKTIVSKGNATIVREARRTITRLQGDGKTVKVLCVGKKGRDSLRRDYSSLIVDSMEGIGRPKLTYDDALRISNRVLSMFDKDEFDVCSIVYNRFKSAISQIVTVQQLVPFAPPEADEAHDTASTSAASASKAVYEFEPSEGAILESLLPRNMGTQIFRALLENNASEQGARMTAMDNATRNAGDLINRLTLTYNRQRQANITKELIEIISGAEAL
ncbi:MAG: ATP synthase F1 subunit gamma [Pseudomonadota bacterium]